MKVSVIVPTFNRASLIAESLDTVAAQTYRPLELIVVDDGSNDDTAHVVNTWMAAHTVPGELDVIFQRQSNRGPSAARNLGLSLASGELVQFLDSDDRLAPERFASLVPLFEEDPELDFVQTGFEGFCADCGAVIEHHAGNPDIEPLTLALRGRLWPNTLRSLFRREVLEGLTWNEAMNCFEDYEFIVRVLAKARRARGVAASSASARRGGQQRVSDAVRSYDGRRQRVACEQALATCIGQLLAEDPKRLDPRDISSFASRLYGLALRSRGSGWPDHAQRCAELADSLGVPLDSLGRRRRGIDRLGRWACRLYEALGQWKSRLKGNAPRQPHDCPRIGSLTGDNQHPASD